MGQRLNIEIIKDGKCIANAYYHWSAFTFNSITIAIDILNKLETFIATSNDTLTAIRLLESTGAGLTETELQILPDSLKEFEFKKCNGRDEGLIAISENGMKDTRAWEEGRISIDIKSKTIDFDVLYKPTEKDILNEYPNINKDKLPRFNENPKALDINQLHDLDSVIFVAENAFSGFFINESQIYQSVY